MKPAIPPESFIDLLLDAVCVVGRDGYLRYVSAASERVFGYRPEEMIGRQILDFVHPADRDKTRQAVAEILKGELKPNFENRYLRKDGSIARIMWSARWSEEEQIRVAVARDVTERRRSEAMQAALYAISEAANSSDSLAAMFLRIHQAVDGLLQARAFLVALADPRTGALNFPYHADGGEPGAAPAANAVALCEQAVRSAGSVPASDASAPGWLAVPLTSPEGVVGAIAVGRELADCTGGDRELLEFVAVQVAAAIGRRQLRTQLEYMASYDSLTGLPNRRLFTDRIRQALERASRHQGHMAVLYLDLDNFKAVNDTHGHSAGDEVLQVMAGRLSRCVRASDTVARLGGDEFVVLLDAIKHPDDAFTVAEKLRSSLGESFKLSVATLDMTPSIGCAVYPGDGADYEALIRHADSAMYRAKRGKH